MKSVDDFDGTRCHVCCLVLGVGEVETTFTGAVAGGNVGGIGGAIACCYLAAMGRRAGAEEW